MSGAVLRRFFVAQGRQAPSCLHEMVFVGRKNMEHDSAKWSCEKSSRRQPTRFFEPENKKVPEEPTPFGVVKELLGISRIRHRIRPSCRFHNSTEAGG